MRKVKFFLILFVAFLLTGCLGEDLEYAPRDSYTELNIQEMHNDYDGNEISAKDKYEYKYFYFSGDIHDISSFGGDNYLTFMFHSDNPNAKTSGIDISAYFASGDMLKDVSKGQNVTVYCKFKNRSIENYMGTSGYSLHSCHFGDKFTEKTE